MKILLTGGSGLLGQELQKYLICDAPTHKEFDIIKPKKLEGYSLIIHAAAYTDVAKAEIEFEKCIELNFLATRRLRETFKNIPFVYISSEYASSTSPNVYGFSKWLGERALFSQDPYLIIRTLFKPNPYPFDRAFKDQYTQGDTVDLIAPKIVDDIMRWNRKISMTSYIGTGRKTMYELAKKTRPDVIPNSVDDIKDVILPKDYL